MVKGLLLILALAMTAGCAAATPSDAYTTTFHYSAYFRLTLPTSSLQGAKVFGDDGPAIKFRDGRSIAALVLTREYETLPAEFDLSSYPKYLFGMESTENLPTDIRGRFERSRSELQHSLDSPQISSVRAGDAMVYAACGARECVLFVTQERQNDQILMITSNGITATEIIKSLME